MVDLVLSELDFNFFFGAPLPGTCMGSRISLNSSRSTSGACGSTGPYILPSFAPTFGMITWYKLCTKLLKQFEFSNKEEMKKLGRRMRWHFKRKVDQYAGEFAATSCSRTCFVTSRIFRNVLKSKNVDFKKISW